jgi:hypothetical protein
MTTPSLIVPEAGRGLLNLAIGQVYRVTGQEKLRIKVSVVPLEINEKLGFLDSRVPIDANCIPLSGSLTASL